MTKKFQLFFIIVSLMILSGITIIQAPKRLHATLIQDDLGFPFEILWDDKFTNFASVTNWRAVVILPQEQLTKNNLDRLFRWYSGKHPASEEVLELKVYTDRSKIPPPDPNIIKDNPIHASGEIIRVDDPYAAIFWRQNDSGAARGGDNEWYRYISDPAKPENKLTVVLRGWDPFTSRKLINSQEISYSTIKIRCSSYTLPKALPSKTYYLFEKYSERWDEWQNVLVFRLDRETIQLDKHVYFLNDKVSYFFIGWVYAVTIDGGLTWSKWSAEKAIPGWNYNLPMSIVDIQINQDGTGVMILTPEPRFDARIKLQTKDFGHHWKAE